MAKLRFLFILSASFLLLSSIEGIGETKVSKRSYLDVKLGIPSQESVTSLIFEIGIKEGFYKRENIELEMYLMKTNLIIAGLLSGQLDYGTPGDIVRAAAVGMPLKQVMVTSGRPSMYLITQPEIKTVKELKGKAIGVGSIGSTNWHVVREVLRYHGLDPDKDVTIMSIGAGMSAPALLSRSVDAINTEDHIVLRKKGYNVLFRAADIMEMPVGGIGTTTKKLKENREEVKRMIRATLKSLLFVRGSKEKIIDYMANTWRRYKDTAEETYLGFMRLYTNSGLVPDKAIEKTLEQAKESGMLDPKSRVPISQVVDFSILREIHRELGITP